MIQKHLLLVFSFAIAPIASTLADDAKRDREALQGTWEAVEVIMDGEPAPEEVRKELKVIFDGGTMKLTGPGGIGKRMYDIKLDAGTSPKSLDMMPQEGPFKGKAAPGIYELRGDTLKLCLPNKGTDRPKEFKSTAGSRFGLFIMKRSKRPSE